MLYLNGHTIKERFKMTDKNAGRYAVTGRTVYLEIYGDNKVIYRVVEGTIDTMRGRRRIYGIETEDTLSGELEAIADYSASLTEAVSFAEKLIRSRARPKQIYSRALSSLCVKI